ncbi:MAG: cell division protein ZapA [Oscillospiraceae bacterium]|nr:cell division protein ZapA [Oscillospiraceae bacterium]
MSQKLTVTVNGQKYAITTTEETDYVQGLAREIDSLIHTITKGSSAMSPDKALLLAALHYLDQLKKTDDNADSLRRQISRYDKEATRARAELQETKKTLAALRQQDGKHVKN